MNKTLQDWEKYREHILKLFMLYEQVKDFGNFNTNYYNLIPRFFTLSKENTTCAFFIKLGFIIKDGKVLIYNFLPNGIKDSDYIKLFKDYKSKLKLIRDCKYAHNDPSRIPVINQHDVENIMRLVRLIHDKICNHFNPNSNTLYSLDVIGNDGIISIEHFIEMSQELKKLKNKISMSPAGGINVKIDSQSGDLIY